MDGEALLLLALLVIIAFAAGCLVGVLAERFMAANRREAWRQRNGWHIRKKNAANTIGAGNWRADESSRSLDAADQLRVVMGADFTPQPLLNKGEARVFKELDQYVLSSNPNWQVMAQVSLGEILSCKDAAAYGCINSKRVDLLLIDDDCQPRHALEYQGEGHYKGTAAARDAVKKEALRRAGIGYHEVLAGHTTPSDLRRLVEKLVDKPGILAGQRPPDDQQEDGQRPVT